jgi:hypothetical protein
MNQEHRIGMCFFGVAHRGDWSAKQVLSCFAGTGRLLLIGSLILGAVVSESLLGRKMVSGFCFGLTGFVPRACGPPLHIAQGRPASQIIIPVLNQFVARPKSLYVLPRLTTITTNVSSYLGRHSTTQVFCIRSSHAIRLPYRL